ncbi:MAG: hypothetical protein M2R45_02663 [Verrucomicrobia subdivision 3 bacterium]|nr:hypothetical protein [Limisphaerales bacterium]MCS1414040.1 hypothetical protein [Limisphaerales bacterium]
MALQKPGAILKLSGGASGIFGLDACGRNGCRYPLFPPYSKSSLSKNCTAPFSSLVPLKSGCLSKILAYASWLALVSPKGLNFRLEYAEISFFLEEFL